MPVILSLVGVAAKKQQINKQVVIKLDFIGVFFTGKDKIGIKAYYKYYVKFAVAMVSIDIFC